VNESGESNLMVYPQLYLEVGNAFLDLKLYLEANVFYRHLLDIQDFATADLHMRIGKCYRGSQIDHLAEKHLKTAIELNRYHTESRIELAKMYEQLGQDGEALILYNEVENILKPPVVLKRSRKARESRKMSKLDKYNNLYMEGFEVDEYGYESENTAPRAPRKLLPKPQDGVMPHSGVTDGYLRDQQPIHAHYSTLKAHRDGMRNDDPKSKEAWARAAKTLVLHFKGHPLFYPPKTQSKLQDAANVAASRPPVLQLPSVYQDIDMKEWLDIFLEYALCLAKDNIVEEAYQVCAWARSSFVFSRSREDMFLIHIAWCSRFWPSSASTHTNDKRAIACAILASDEETCLEVAIFFAKEYQFTAEAYGMFAAIMRMSNTPVSWYGSSRSVDLIMRHVKQMDQALHRLKQDGTGPFALADGRGGFIEKETMEISLLMLCGHILYASGSYQMALSNHPNL
jgi:general transcription factor 3C polypeptide 3 (transcription factor C subunit 4)